MSTTTPKLTPIDEVYTRLAEIASWTEEESALAARAGAYDRATDMALLGDVILTFADRIEAHFDEEAERRWDAAQESAMEFGDTRTTPEEMDAMRRLKR